jgi:hypothetical protein
VSLFIASADRVIGKTGVTATLRFRTSAGGALATGSEYVDGTFLDDSQAIPQEHPNAPANAGLSALQLLLLQNASYEFFNAAVAQLAANGDFIWQGFNGLEQGDPDGVGVSPTSGTCQAYMEQVCDPAWQQVPRTMQWPGAQADRLPVLAAFLVSRGPFDFIGTGWFGAGSIGLPAWDPLWDAYDVGEPTGLCAQTAPGVFSRSWTRGTDLAAGSCSRTRRWSTSQGCPKEMPVAR